MFSLEEEEEEEEERETYHFIQHFILIFHLRSDVDR